MENADDKNWASKYLLDPLNAPDPSQETGPGASFRVAPRTATPPAQSAASSNFGSKNPFNVHSRKVSSNGSDKLHSYPSPPQSASPRREAFPHHRQDAFADYNTTPPYNGTSNQGTSTNTLPTGRRRGSSLTERYPGDRSTHPFDMLKQEAKTANRAPHLRKKHIVRPDIIDNLDNVGGTKYHHEGPFDVTYAARNTSFNSSPLEALSGSNEEALKATPREKIVDSVERRRPLDGVAIVPPGMPDANGNVYHYKEGTNLMIEDGGNYKRWPGVEYLPEDVKGKGEPSYSLEKALKDHKSSSHRRVMSDGIEMTSTRPRSSDGSTYRPSGGSQDMWADGDGESGIGRSNTTGRKSSGTLKKRFGSLRRRRD